jgi:nucleoside-diphosphate-sugar epimerase
METVIVIGCDGYIGHALTLRLLELGYRVIGIDDFQRREHVKEMESFSAIEIEEPRFRHEKFKYLFGKDKFKFFNFNIEQMPCDLEMVLEDYNDPVAIVNLAQQPSAPFSLKSEIHATETTINNLIGTMNLMYCVKRICPDTHVIQIGSMGEYDHAAGTAIPEGTFDLNFEGRVAPNVIFPRRPGSFYHASKVASTYYMDCASRWWGLTFTDIMQGVVYGNWTPEIEKYGSDTRLDSDECFGTVVNRFIVQVVLGEPMTIYGEGGQKRGYLGLNDSVQCLVLAVQNAPRKGAYRTWNQLDTTHSIGEISQIVDRIARNYDLDPKMVKIPSPRVEKTDPFYYKVYTEKLKVLGFEPTRKIADDVEWSFRKLLPHKDELYPLSNVVMPEIKWR